MTAPRVAILGFHKIGDPPPPPVGWESWFYVSVPTFDRFLGELATRGFEVIDLDRFLLGLDEPDSLPERSALVTFDDGYRSMLGATLPVLQKHGAPGVLFVPTDHVGGRNGFDHGVEPEEPICSWDELRSLRDAGVAIQSHAHTHRAFSSSSSSVSCGRPACRPARTKHSHPNASYCGAPTPSSACAARAMPSCTTPRRPRSSSSAGSGSGSASWRR
jgi:hypothetical protein